MSLTVFIFYRLAVIFLLALLSYVAGRRIMLPIRFSSVWEKIAFSTSLGLGLIAYLVFLLGWLGILYISVILPLLIALQFFCYPVWRDLWRKAPLLIIDLLRSKKLLLALLIAVPVIAPGFLFALFPPTAYDSIMYHLPLAKIYVQNHQIVPAPYIRFAFSPQTNELLFALVMLFDTDVTAQLVEWLMMLLTAVTLFAWGSKIFSFPTGLLAAAFWLATPLVFVLGSSAYIDVGLTLFVTLSALAMFNWLSGRKTYWLVLAGVFAGLSAGSKYSALFFVGIYGLLILYIGLRERRFSYPMIFSLVAGLVASPWYLRNFYDTGNPLFPFAMRVFGERLWNAQDLQYQIIDWTRNGIFGGSFEFYYDGLLLAFPVLFILPLAVFYGIYETRLRVFLIFILAFVIFWLSSASLPRYLLPVWPLAALAAAVSIRLLANRFELLRRSFQRNSVVIAGALLIIFPCWLFAAFKVYKRMPVPVSKAQREEYLTQQLPTYPAYKFLNEKSRNYKLYALYDSNMAYYADGTFMGDWFGPARFRDVTDSLENGETLYRKLRSLNADYFLAPSAPGPPVNLPDDDFFQEHFHLIFSTAEVRIYELSDD